MPPSFSTLQVDENGFLHWNQKKIEDNQLGYELLNNVTWSENRAFITHKDESHFFLEAHDQPFVAHNVIPRTNDLWDINLPYGVTKTFYLKSLCVDEWDRFHGLTKDDNLPFVMSRKAQSEFFENLDSFDDESITFKNKTYQVLPLYSASPDINSSPHWDFSYQKNTKPGWELDSPHPLLVENLPKLKLSRQRILVLGSGSGNDAAHFAKAGHIVTAYDFSKEAIDKAKSKYEGLKSITWKQEDIFKASIKPQQFDLIFEHTCYCAIDPIKRNQLVSLWKSCLSPQGFLMGIFFTMWRTQAPPFGGSEWEYKKRLDPHFRYLFWNRIKPQQSPEGRQGKELFIYAQLY